MTDDDAVLVCRAEAERLGKAGDPLRAYDVASAGLERRAGDLRLCQVKALALATAEGMRDVYCEYVGKTAWAGHHAVFAAYYVRRSQPGAGADD